MAREFQRSSRVAEQIQRVLAQAIRAELADPGVHGVVITSVRVARDLGSAQISYSLLQGPDEAESAQAALERAAGYLRSALARELETRTVPELRFRFDTEAERVRRLDQLIDQAVRLEDGQLVPPVAPPLPDQES
jgi:ribosome-binding factor A